MAFQLPHTTSPHSNHSFVPVGSSASALQDSGNDGERPGGGGHGIGVVVVERRQGAELGLLAAILHLNILYHP